MVLSRLTKITGPGVRTDTNWVGNNADFTGITTTATSFNIGVTTIHSTLVESHNIVSTGVITATGGSFSGNVTAVDGTFSGNVSIAGTLTYEDVTNIDSVGIITAPALDIDDFLDVGSNIKLGNAGVITATSFVGSGAALTGIDATAIKDSDGNVKVQAQASGAVYTGIHTFNSDLDVDGHTNLDNVSVAGVSTFAGNINGKDITLTDTTPSITFYDSNANSDYRIIADNGVLSFADITNNANRINIFSNGNVKVLGNLDALDGIDVTGNTTVSGDLDVDGHTNLDNVSIAGVTTANGNITISNEAPRLKFHDTNHNPDFDLLAEGGRLFFQNTTNPSNAVIIDLATKLATFGGGVDVDDFVDVGSNIQLGNAGVITATTFKGDGDFVELDVDGHTNLDNVSIAGVSTFASAIY